MHILTGGKQYPCRDYRPGVDSITFALSGAVPEALGETVALRAESGFLMVTHRVSEWERWEVSGGALVLTNLPVPEPTPGPTPEPKPDPLTETQLAVAELAQVVEDNNTANQLAIAELAELMTGGATNG